MSSSTTSPPKLSTTERVNKSKSYYLLIFYNYLELFIYNYFPIWNLIFPVKTPEIGGKIWNLKSWLDNVLSLSIFDMTIVINVKMFWKFNCRKICENLGFFSEYILVYCSWNLTFIRVSSIFRDIFYSDSGSLAKITKKNVKSSHVNGEHLNLTKKMD